MTQNAYDIGDLVRCTGTFAASGTNVNPEASYVQVQDAIGCDHDIHLWARMQRLSGIRQVSITLM